MVAVNRTDRRTTIPPDVQFVYAVSKQNMSFFLSHPDTKQVLIFLEEHLAIEQALLSKEEAFEIVCLYADFLKTKTENDYVVLREPIKLFPDEGDE